MTLESHSRLSGIWRRVPVGFRAVFGGLGVMAIGVWSWPILLAAVPLPWSPLAMILVLWVYWEFFTGRRWRSATAGHRRWKSRSGRLTVAQLRWGLVAAGAFVVIVQASFVATFRIVPFPAETFTSGFDLDAAQPVTAWLIIIVASVVAAVCEELGFRGYLQVPLESRYNTVIAITVGSVFFALVHLTQPWAMPILAHLFGLSVLLGILAHAGGSLIPVIVAHTALDLINFSYWWSNVAGSFERRPIGEVGIDFHFIGSLTVLAVGVGLFIWAIRMLRLARGRSQAGIGAFGMSVEA